MSDSNFPDEPALRPIPEFCRKYRVGRDYVYEQIRDGDAEFRAPNLFRLTYKPTRVEGPTDDWRRIEAFDDAIVLARAARLARSRTRAHARRWGMSVIGARAENICSE